MVYQTEKFVKENEDKISPEQKADLDSAVEELKAALAADDTAAIKAGVDRVSTKSQEVGAAMYAAGAEAASDSEGAATEDDDIVEGEVVDEDNNK